MGEGESRRVGGVNLYEEKRNPEDKSKDVVSRDDGAGGPFIGCHVESYRRVGVPDPQKGLPKSY